MKMINPSMISGPNTTQHSKAFERIRRIIRAALGAIGWSLLILAVLLTAYFTGWILLAALLLRSGPTGDIYPMLLVLVGLSGGLAWLVARYIASWRRVRQAIMIAFTLVLIVGAIWALVYPDGSLFLARQVGWGDSTLKDYELFPERSISNAPPVFHFQQKLSPELFQSIEYRSGLDLGGVDSWAEVFQSMAAKVRDLEQPPSADTFPAHGWRISPPEDQGIDSVRLAESLQAIQQDGTRIHSLMIVRNGAVILDAYFYPYDGSIYHDLASVTKSIVTTLIGIAADQGKLDLDQPMLSFFPGRVIANRDERKERITVRHLASMTAGLDCDPLDDEPTLDAMRASADWVQFALDRKAIREPGTRFVYCGLQMHLLSAILQEATGMTALEFARLNLFEPLSIHDVYWPSDPQGYTHGWGDVCLHPEDMARLGFLFLNQGQWDGKQIVSREWVMGATKRQAGTNRKDDYGYGWWVSRPENEFAFFGADGNGGQYIRVIPSLNLVLVTTGGGFSMPEIDPYLIATLGDMDKPLPANPNGVARLEAVVAELGQPPAAQAVPPLPEMARTISGKTFEFEPNPLKLQSTSLVFDASAEALFRLEVANEPGLRLIGVGLDGVYRASHGGRPVFARGSWADASTFVIDYNEGPGLATYTIRLRFDHDWLLFELLGIGNFEARME